MLGSIKKIFVIILLTYTPLISLANNDQSAGQAYQDAINGISRSTNDLKQKTFQRETLMTPEQRYNNANFLSKIFINLSDTFHISISFLITIIWLIGVTIFATSWINLKQAIESNSGGDYQNNLIRKRMCYSGMILAIFLMGFNAVVMIFADTAAIGNQVNRTYDFTNSDQKISKMLNKGHKDYSNQFLLKNEYSRSFEGFNQGEGTSQGLSN